MSPTTSLDRSLRPDEPWATTWHRTAWVAVAAMAVLSAVALTAGGTLARAQGLGSTVQVLIWSAAATTDAQFHRTLAGGVLMLLGALVAHECGRRRGRSFAGGFPVSAGTGRLPAVLVASLASLLLSTVLWGWVVTATATWQPLFVAFVSVPAAVVLTYGTAPRAVLTGVVAGSLLTAPLSLALNVLVCQPLLLSPVVAATAAMWCSAVLTFTLCRVTGWLVPRPAAPPPSVREGRWWIPRRALADLTEPQFIGNELAGAGMLLGVVVTGLLAPRDAVYGSGLWLHLVLAQLATALLSVTLWRHRWRRHGWYPTFVPLVSLVPAMVLQHGGSLLASALAAVLGATLMPPVAHVLGYRMRAPIHPFTGCVLTMALACVTIVPLARVLLPGAA